jgi:DNA-binding transcriptional ArsR family regulator
MTTNTPPLTPFEPERECIIHDIEALRIYFDPLRLRIVQEIADQARSIHDIAERLGVPFTRLYYHINLLEKHGIIRLVDVRPGVGAIEEKFYRVAAYFFVVDRALMTPGTPAGDEGLEAVLDTVLTQSRRSIVEAVDAGLIDLSVRSPHPDALLIARGVFSLTPEQAQTLQLRLKQLIVELTSQHIAPTPQAQPYNFAITLHRTVLSGGDVLPFEPPA